MADLKQFRELFNPLPGNHYLYVTLTPDDIATLFYEMMQQIGGGLNLAIYNKDSIEFASGLCDANIQHIKDFKTLFRAAPRNHDIVVLKDILYAHENPKALLKIAYTTLANTANIIIIEKKGVMDVEAMKALLEEHEFRSANEIDVIDGYDLVIAKKMHMWGNGL